MTRINEADGDPPARVEMTFTLTEEKIAAVKGALTATLAELAGAKTDLAGGHRSGYAGGGRRLPIDATAVVFFAISAIRFLLFPSLRFRLGTALMTASLVVMAGQFKFAAV